jgi:N-acetylglucosaminyldiphosphoundecaprenol N-acetyl-beta-D-mannosaminyltransferase
LDRSVHEYPNVKIGTHSPPYKTEFTFEDNAIMVEAINSFRPDVLFIGMTAPKQEKWAYQHYNKLDTGHICCIGAVFDFYAGTIQRAPKWIIDLGLEWFFRFLKEPRRMWRRYLIGNTEFIWLIIKEKITRHKI